LVKCKKVVRSPFSPTMSIRVFRLGHRPIRDKRVTAHLFLAARAFGASGAFYSGIKDASLEETSKNVCIDWGGQFKVEYKKDWRDTLSKWKRCGKIVHLTMYGVPLPKVMEDIRKDPSEKLIVVGGAKVSGEVYTLSDWNVAVTSQPHSEVSALAVFLNEFFHGEMMEKVFEGARMRVVPQERGKKIETLSDAL
jgi:tRNA (cytidine56-2'-O)-methyltransferase